MTLQRGSLCSMGEEHWKTEESLELNGKSSEAIPFSNQGCSETIRGEECSIGFFG